MNNDTEKTGNWTLLSKSLLSVNFEDAYEQNLASMMFPQKKSSSLSATW